MTNTRQSVMPTLRASWLWFPLFITWSLCTPSSPILATDLHSSLDGFFSSYCNDCHGGGSEEGGLSLENLSEDLNDIATFYKWERIFDRVVGGEMPPESEKRINTQDMELFETVLRKSLSDAHQSRKGTVLRRLNRREYQNTLNDLFGTSLDLESMLPEDSRFHEFDNVGEALSLSMTHMQRYMEAAGMVFDAAVATTVAAPKPDIINCFFRESEVDRELGKTVKRLEDGALVRYSPNGLSRGHLREGRTRQPGKYRIRVTGYAYQSKESVVVDLSGISYRPGSAQPLLGFCSFPPNTATTFEVITWIDENYMLKINPYGLVDPNHYKRLNVNEIHSPGFALLSATMEGPLVEKFPSQGHRLVLDGISRVEIEPKNPSDKTKSWYKPKFEIQSENEVEDVKQSLNRVATRAFRHPVTSEEVQPFLELFIAEREKGESFEMSLRTAVIAIFSSPSFLYLEEPDGDTSDNLTDHALANRLSYFLNRTAPDQLLSEMASTGELTQPRGRLREQADRLMADENFSRFLRDFCDAWLNLREMDFTTPDAKLFPEYDSFLHDSIRKETESFLEELIVSNLPVSNLVKSDFAMLNNRLADHYALPPVDGVKLQKVVLSDDSVRGGLLSQASILKVTANGTNTSPVFRGLWVMERILGETTPPPPPGIPGVEPDIRGASTLRELLSQHRNASECQSCHQKIDPLGFALEQFNPIGGFRHRYRTIGEGDKVDIHISGRAVRYRLGRDVDATGILESGEAFQDFRGLRDILAEDQNRLARSLTIKLLTFATGREMGFSDRAEIDRIVQESAEKNYGVRDLIHLVIDSSIFKKK